MAETNNLVKTDDIKSWKKLELQKWLRIHGLKVTGTKDELVVRVENAKRAGVNPNSSCMPPGRVTSPGPSRYSVLLCTIMSQLERESCKWKASEIT